MSVYPVIRTYNEALRYVNDVKPVYRGGCRRLPLRTDRGLVDRFSIGMWRIDSVAVSVDGEHVLIYLPNGDIIVNIPMNIKVRSVCRLASLVLGMRIGARYGCVVVDGGVIASATDAFVVRDGRVLPEYLGVVLQATRRVLPKHRQAHRELSRWFREYKRVKRFMPEGWRGTIVQDLNSALGLPSEERALCEPLGGFASALGKLRRKVFQAPTRRGRFVVINRSEADRLVANGDAWALDS